MKLSSIFEHTNISCESDLEISGLNTLIDSSKNELTFLQNKKYLKRYRGTKENHSNFFPISSFVKK